MAISAVAASAGNTKVVKMVLTRFFIARIPIKEKFKEMMKFKNGCCVQLLGVDVRAPAGKPVPGKARLAV